MSTPETASLVQQIANLRDVIDAQRIQIAALQALDAPTPESAKAEADATILAWGPRFHSMLSWELEHEADAHTAIEAWEQLVLQMATAKHAAPAPSSEDTPPPPRVWQEGDDEPEGVDLLRDTDDGHRAFPFARRNTDGRWCWVKTPDESPSMWHGLPWKELLADAYGPLSEVPTPGGAT